MKGGRKTSSRLIGLAIAAWAGVFSQSALSAREFAAGEAEDPFNRINSAAILDGKIQQPSAVDLPEEAFSNAPFERNKAEVDLPKQPREKIHPRLKKWIETRKAGETELVLINLRDTTKMPRFPEAAMREAKDSPANKAARGRAEELVREVHARRAPAYDRFLKEVDPNGRMKVREKFWLVQAILVELPLDAIAAIAAREDVL